MVVSTMAMAVEFESGSKQTALIELYSSEGCSSCPPAETWLGSLRTRDGLWRDFVPVAFHVDYWNRLGWLDRFSRADFTQRQYALAQSWRSPSVYTPCFARNGAEWKRSDAVREVPSTDVGVLKLRMTGDLSGEVEYSPSKSAGDLDAHVVLLGGGFSSKVTRGENQGSTLAQEFVVLEITNVFLQPKGLSQRAEFVLPKSRITDGTRRAIAVWVTERGGFAPLQATGGWLRNF